MLRTGRQGVAQEKEGKARRGSWVRALWESSGSPFRLKYGGRGARDDGEGQAGAEELGFVLQVIGNQ